MSDQCAGFGTTRISIVQFVLGLGLAVPLWCKGSLRAPPCDPVEAAVCPWKLRVISAKSGVTLVETRSVNAAKFESVLDEQ